MFLFTIVENIKDFLIYFAVTDVALIIFLLSMSHRATVKEVFKKHVLVNNVAFIKLIRRMCELQLLKTKLSGSISETRHWLNL